MLTSDLTSLVPLQFSHWRQVRKVVTPVITIMIMMIWQPHWCSKTMKRRPCWCSKPVLCELNLLHMLKLSLVPINLYRCGSLNLTSFKPLKLTFAKDLAATSFPGSSSTRPPERERGRGKSRWGPWERGWYSWCPYYWGVRNIQRKSLGESWLNICKFKSDLILTVMSFVSVRVLITPDSKCFTAVSVRTDGAELKERKLVNQNPLQVVVPIIDTG